MNETELNLAARRKELGLTQAQVSKEIKVSNTTLVDIEAGRFRCKDKTALSSLAKLLGIPYEDVSTAAQNNSGAQVHVKKLCKRKFIPNLSYRFQIDDVHEDKILRYVRKEGVHHIFQSPLGGWLICFTDRQLIGVEIQAVED